MSEPTAVAERPRTPAAEMDFPAILQAYKAQIALALPKHLNAERMTRIALTCYRMTPLLARCHPTSVFAAVVQAAQLGLEPGLNGQAYLVPFWNARMRRYECQLIPGYRGLIALARRSGEIESINVHIVYSLDHYEVELGTTERLTHRPRMDAERGTPVFAYCIARFKGGGQHIEHMLWSEILAIRSRSKSRSAEGVITGPWATDLEEMARKTVVRRASKYWPMSVELATAVQMDQLAAKGISQGLDIETAIKGDYVAVDEEPQQEAAPPTPTTGEPAEVEAHRSTAPSRIRAKVEARQRQRTIGAELELQQQAREGDSTGGPAEPAPSEQAGGLTDGGSQE
jgi:recombination protein RecT